MKIYLKYLILILCNTFKKVGSPIYFYSPLKGSHFSLKASQKISEEIDGHLLNLKRYNPIVTQDEKNKLILIKYALCTCTKDRHNNLCSTRGLELKIKPLSGLGGKRRKTKRRKSIKKRRRYTRRR